MKRGWLFGLLIAVLVALDQASKYWVEQFLEFQVQVPVMPFLSLLRTYNEGIAFSFLSNIRPEILIAIPVLVMAVFAILWRLTPAHKWITHLGFALILAGALGNVIDRVVLGYVIDMIQFHTQTWSFAIFNLADVFVSIGGAMIVFDEFFGSSKTATENSEV